MSTFIDSFPNKLSCDTDALRSVTTQRQQEQHSLRGQRGTLEFFQSDWASWGLVKQFRFLSLTSRPRSQEWGRGDTQEFLFLKHTPKGGARKRDDKFYTASNLDQFFTFKEFFLISPVIWEQPSGLRPKNLLWVWADVVQVHLTPSDL